MRNVGVGIFGDPLAVNISNFTFKIITGVHCKGTS